MTKLTYIAVLLLSCSADPKAPRIYNVLISSKKNLSPSHAQPVYEPVLRTTSIGYAFPSIFYHTSFVQNVPITYPQLPLNKEQNINIFPQQVPQGISKDSQGNEPADVTHLIPPYDPYALNYANYLPNDQGTAAAESNSVSAVSEQTEENDPKKVIANLKRNPGIPDVPPPPIPVKIAA